MSLDLTIRYEGLEATQAIDTHVRKRMEAALDQHDSHVRSVRVTLRDINAMRGGVDKSCDAHVMLQPPASPIIIKKQHHDLYLAITNTADAVKQTVGRALQKDRDSRIA